MTPDHYNLDGIDAMESIKASMSQEAFLGFLKGNCIKYSLRLGRKGDGPADYASDAYKLADYANRYRQEIDEGGRDS